MFMTYWKRQSFWPALAIACALMGGALTSMSATPTLAQPAGKSQDSAPSAPELKQMKLTEQNIKGFLGAQKDLIAITAKLEAAGDTIDEKLQKELDQIASKNGFKDFADFEDIRSNIMLVMAGIDPDNGQYSDPIELIKKDIEAIKSDKTLSDADRKSQLDEMQDALKEMQPLQFPDNVELVKKYAKQIDEVLK
jgi:hypothetical protein